MNQEDIQQKVVTTDSGQQVFIQDTPLASITIHLPDDPVVSEKPADEFTITELQNIIGNTTLDDIQSATMSKNISVSPPIESKETEQMQTDTNMETK